MDVDFYFPDLFRDNFWLFTVSENIENHHENGMYARGAWIDF